jgi:DNA-directed RNA polymerase specialized sigma24 family protein
VIACFLLKTVAHPRKHVAQPAADAGRAPVPRAPAERLTRLLDTLTARERHVLTLRVQLAYSTDETARALGVTPDHVRVTQHRALEHLREALGAQAG